ncbi:MAG: 50S ribosomal protein L15 [Chloroflexi bacterium]|nr:50S ribosomal protein L15 [Chloroflexota bacterium]MBU1750900.1 50S ribosomal protein L15 [Chloroflexota bacterium]
MKLHELHPAPGSRKNRIRAGRGDGGRRGKTAGRGTKGQNSRSGGGVRPYFEGGQLPLVRRLPHVRGFTNIFAVKYAVVNVGYLEQFPAHTEITPALLHEMGLVRHGLPVKVLGDGELSRPLTVHAHRFSASARLKIEAAGGEVLEL